MHALRPAESIASWGFRWLQTVPRPDLILSGMSDCSQMADNTKTFSEERPLNGEELALLEKLAGHPAPPAATAAPAALRGSISRS